MPLPTVADLVRTRIRHLLYAADRTQEELARYLGISPPYLSQILCGERGVRINDLALVARFFGLSVAELFVIDGQAFRDRRTGFDRRAGSDRRTVSERRTGRDRRVPETLVKRPKPELVGKAGSGSGPAR